MHKYFEIHRKITPLSKDRKNTSILSLLSFVDGIFLHLYYHHNGMNQFNLQFSLIMKDDIQEISTSEFSLGEKKIGTD
jgi:hypothetical protein